ncbi:MAG: hypothetical protein E7663_02810 [Ruminococcaceae bacterium]|nr:hypothetical protein [Oscillospiraceae bacterium]
MNKTFYKRKQLPKVFFDRHMQVRSYAYGSEVHARFLEWQRDYVNARGGTGEKLIIAAQSSIYGVGDTAHARVGDASVLPPLLVDGMRFTADADGWVSIGGSRTALNLGLELKAWALLTLSERQAKRQLLCVIGKPNGVDCLKLSLYPVSRRGVDEHAEQSLDMEHTLSAESFLICLGRHMFVVHNTQLHYYYYHPERGGLEEVAIGGDLPCAEAPACRQVLPRVVTNTAGYVFWMSGDTVYGFPVGYPRRLLRIECDARETLSGITCVGEALLVYRKSKNTSRLSCVRYVKGQGGELIGTPLDENARRMYEGAKERR